MKRALGLAALPLLLLSPAGPTDQSKSQAAPASADCSFSHPQLPGRCWTTVPVPRGSNPQQACDGVLRCINGSYCPEADRYCHNPGVPKTWKLEDAIPTRARVNCAYSNPTSSGWCRLTAPVPKGMTPRQACEAVVPCLNGSPCEGYIHLCDPDNRAGWKLEEVSPAPPRPTPAR